MRVVRQPDGTVVVDRTGRRNGRGAYLCADPACWSLALRKRTLERALGSRLSPSLVAELATGPGPGLPVGEPAGMEHTTHADPATPARTDLPAAAAPLAPAVPPTPDPTIEGGARGQE